MTSAPSFTSCSGARGLSDGFFIDLTTKNHLKIAGGDTGLFPAVTFEAREKASS